MINKQERVSNILRTLTIIIAIISLLVNVWLYKENLEKTQTKQALESTILHQIDTIIATNREIKRLEGLLEDAEYRADSLRNEAEEYRNLRDSLLLEIGYLEFIIDRLKEELNESITIPDMSDDEHIQFFLEWTTIDTKTNSGTQ